MKIYLVTKKLQESKKENRENRNKDMFSYQEIARKWKMKIENIKRLVNLILVTCLITKKVQYKLIKLLQVGCNSTHQDSRTIFYKAFSFKIRRIKIICSYSREIINLCGRVQVKSNYSREEKKLTRQMDKFYELPLKN